MTHVPLSGVGKSPLRLLRSRTSTVHGKWFQTPLTQRRSFILSSRRCPREANVAVMLTYAVSKRELPHAVRKMKHQCNHELRSRCQFSWGIEAKQSEGKRTRSSPKCSDVLLAHDLCEGPVLWLCARATCKSGRGETRKLRARCSSRALRRWRRFRGTSTRRPTCDYWPRRWRCGRQDSCQVGKRNR